MWVSHEECETHLAGRLEGVARGRAIPVLRSSAGNHRCVLAVFPRIMAAASSFHHLQQPWVAVGTSEACCDTQLCDPVTREGLWDSHFPASMGHKEAPAAIFSLFLPSLCHVSGGRGCSQPAHGMQQICSADELSFLWVSLHSLCKAELRCPMASLVRRCSCAGGQEAGGVCVCIPHTHAVLVMLIESKQMALCCVKPTLRNAAANSKQYRTCFFWGWTRGQVGE